MGLDGRLIHSPSTHISFSSQTMLSHGSVGISKSLKIKILSIEEYVPSSTVNLNLYTPWIRFDI